MTDERRALEELRRALGDPGALAPADAVRRLVLIVMDLERRLSEVERRRQLVDARGRTFHPPGAQWDPDIGG